MKNVRTVLSRSGFSLMEVLLSIAVFTFGVLALLGLMGKTLTNISQVEEQNISTNLNSTIDGYLRKQVTFDTLYAELKSKGRISLFAFYTEPTDGSKTSYFPVHKENVRVTTANPVMTQSELDDLVGSIYKVIIEPAIFTSAEDTVQADGTVIPKSYTDLKPTAKEHPDPYLHLSVTVYAYERPAQIGSLPTENAHPTGMQPVRTYMTTINR